MTQQLAISAQEDCSGGRWFAVVNGQILTDKHGFKRRFHSEAAALKAARRATA